MRKPDMLLTAENGWLGDFAHGPDKVAELRQAMDEYLAEMGMEPVDWSRESGSNGAKADDGPAPQGSAVVNRKGPEVRIL